MTGTPDTNGARAAMKAFDTPFWQQLENVLAGLTADGERTHGLWPLPGILPLEKDTACRIAFTAICEFEDEGTRDDEDVRTCVLWMVSAHLRRLLKSGNIMERAARQISWMCNLYSSRTEFAACVPFIRTLLPGRLPEPPTASRRERRRDMLKILHRVDQHYRPRDDAPFQALTERDYRVVQYRRPDDCIRHPHSRHVWEDTLRAMKRGEPVDHGYWLDLIHGKRLAFALFVETACVATFENAGGRLINIKLQPAATPATLFTLTRACTTLAYLYGTEFRTDADSGDATIRAYRAAWDQRLQEAAHLWPALKQKVEEKSNTRPFMIPGSTDQWIGGLICVFALSYVIPALIVVAPDFARSYAHVWRAAFGLEPACPASDPYAARSSCLFPPANLEVPIPAHRGDAP